MNKQRKVVITTTYNEMGIIIDTKAEEVAQPNLQPTCNQLATDTISRQAAIDAVRDRMGKGETNIGDTFIECFEMILNALPSAQPEQLERCPIYGGVCGYPSDHCYECPNHHDTKVANGMELPSTQIDDFDRNFIALRIKCALGDTGYTQRELSEMTGITQVTISRYVNGLRIPSATNLKAIADALGVGIEYFFAEREKSLPSAQPEKRTEKRTETHACDCIDRQAAIDAIVAWTVEDRPDIEMPTDLVGRINALPPAQPELIAQGAYVRGFEQEKTQGMVDAKLQPTCNKLATDCISRQAAIDALDEYFERIGKLKRRGLNKGEKAISLDTVGAIKSLPPAQPEPQWIPCSERLPKCSDRKQVQLSNSWIITAYFELGDWYAVPPMYDEDDTHVSLKEAGYRVIAWRELPEPWKGEQE